MLTEVVNLKRVHLLGGHVPRVLDDFVDAYSAEPCGFVMEQVEGKTLDEFVRARGAVDLATAASIARQLADTIAIGHEVEIGHRDIKPKNIMVTVDEPPAAVLLDYGLSFSSTSEPATKVDELIRNVFLHLPELMEPGGDRRYIESDVTLLAAVLLYLINGGRDPVTLRDSQDRPPHRRAETAVEVELGENRSRHLAALFDKAFQQEIGYRFSTVIQFVEALDHVLTVDEQGQVDLVALLAEVEVDLLEANPAAKELRARDAASRRAMEVCSRAATRLEEIASHGMKLSATANTFGGVHPYSDELKTMHLSLHAQHLDSQRAYRTTYIFRSNDNHHIVVSRNSHVWFEDRQVWVDVLSFAVDSELNEVVDSLVADGQAERARAINSIREAELAEPSDPAKLEEIKERRRAQQQELPDRLGF